MKQITVLYYTKLIASVFVALALSIWPVSGLLLALKPHFVALVVIYWALWTPARFGLLAAFFIGLWADITTQTLLGQHALAFILLTFLTQKVHQRLRLFPLLQQTGVVLVFLGFYQLTFIWVQGMLGELNHTSLSWLGVLFTALLWPLTSLFAPKIKSLIN